MPSRKPKKLPPDLYEKGKETVKEAQNCPDPEMKKFMLEAARRYYDADIKQNTPLPLWALSIALVVFYLLILGTMVWAFSKLSGLVAAFVCVASFAFLSLLVGAVLRVGGYISESGLMAVWKAGFKAVTSLERDAKQKGK